jgi:hypothetical protein
LYSLQEETPYITSQDERKERKKRERERKKEREREREGGKERKKDREGVREVSWASDSTRVHHPQ